MFEADDRFTDPTTGDERVMLAGFLSTQRKTLAAKCAGLTDADLATRSVPPSTLSLLGLVRHLTDVERRWFRHVLAAEDAPPHYSSPTTPDGDFDNAAPENVTEAWHQWHTKKEFADNLTASLPLDATGHDSWRGEVSLRWVLIHMVEEYARHNGHADLLRERIDGRIGL